MRMHHLVQAGLLVLVGLGPLAGCTGWGDRKIPDVKPLREARAQQARADFAQQQEAALYAAAQSHWRQGNTAAARQTLEKLLSRSTQHREAHLLLVEVLLVDEDALAATRAGERAIEQFGDDPLAWELFGAAWELAGDKQAADDCYAAAAQLLHNHDDDERHDDDGRLPAAEQRMTTDSAIAQATHATAQATHAAATGNSPPGLQQPRSLSETTASGDSQPGAAANSRTTSSRDTDAHATGLRQLQAELHEALRRPEQAAGQPQQSRAAETTKSTSAATATATKSPTADDLQILIRRGGTALAGGAVQSAGDYLMRVVRSPACNESLALQAVVLALRHEQAALAAQLAQTALQRHGDSAALLRSLGIAQFDQGHYSAARAALQQALYLDNAHPLTYFFLGRTLEQLGSRDAADWHYRQARQRDPRYAQLR